MRAGAEAGFVLMGLMLTAGCSASTAPRGAAQPASLGSPSMQAPSRAEGAKGCFPAGAPQIIATHVAPRAGIDAYASGSRVALRFATTALKRVAVDIDPESLDVVPGTSPAAALEVALRGPLEVRLDDGRGLFAWTDGSTYRGLRVRTQGFRDQVLDAPAPADLGFQGSAIGRPAAALTAKGRGVLAFIESNGDGFQLVVTRLACADAGSAG
jgi:hypothetical protein